MAKPILDDVPEVLRPLIEGQEVIERCQGGEVTVTLAGLWNHWNPSEIEAAITHLIRAWTGHICVVTQLQLQEDFLLPFGLQFALW